MINIPEDVKKYLLKDEVVDKQFELGEHNVFATANRIFVKTGDTVRDINFTHISSIEWQVKRRWEIVIIGIIIIIIILCLAQLNPPDWDSVIKYGRLVYSTQDIIRAFFIVLGIVLVIFGYRWKIQRLEISVEGISEKQIFKASKSNKDALFTLFQLMNTRRILVKSNHTYKTSTLDTM